MSVFEYKFLPNVGSLQDDVRARCLFRRIHLVYAACVDTYEETFYDSGVSANANSLTFPQIACVSTTLENLNLYLNLPAAGSRGCICLPSIEVRRENETMEFVIRFL